MKKIIIAKAPLVQSPRTPNLFYVDDKGRDLYLYLEPTRNLKSYVGQIVTISVEVPEETPCCSIDFEKRVLEIIRDTLEKAL